MIFSTRSLDLGAEQNRYIRLVQQAREQLEKSLLSGSLLDKDSMTILTNIGIALERAVSAKIKYERHQKAFAEQLSKEEEESAVEEFIIGMDVAPRANLISRLITRHNSLVGEKDDGSRIQSKASEEGRHSSDSGLVDEVVEKSKRSRSNSK